MGILGKILIFFLLITAGAFVYIATMNWAERQEWTYSYFRHELAIKGLPVESGPPADDPEKVSFPFKYENAGGLKVIDKKILENVFQTSRGPTAADPNDRTAVNPPVPGGGPVASQVEEVKRVQQAVNDRIQAADGAAAKMAVVRSYLVNLVTDPEERDAIRVMPPDELAKAREMLDGYFDRALQPVQGPVSVTDESRSEAGRRRAIAHLLYHIGIQPTAPGRGGAVAENNVAWQKRVLTVVGLETYVEVVAIQAGNLNSMVRRLELAIAKEEGEFPPVYRELVERSRRLSGQYDEVFRKVETQKDAVQRQTILRNARLAEVNKMEKDLFNQRAEVRKELQAQAKLEQQLFDTQVQLGAALDAIVRLEAELQDLELGAKGDSGQ